MKTLRQKKYLPKIRKIVGDKVPKTNFIGEPLKKNTGMAILFAAGIISRQNPDAVINTLPSDHFIKDLNSFKDDLRTAARIAVDHHKIVIIGIQPSNPNPSFGYIVPGPRQSGFYNVSRFAEKPSVIDANLLIRKEARWNSGIYTFTAADMFNEFSQHQPLMSGLLPRLVRARRRPRTLMRLYRQSPSLAIDKAISELSKNMAMIPARFQWSDVGEWGAIWKQLTHDDEGHAHMVKGGKLISLNSRNCLLHSESKKIIGMVGINNLAIIDTPDALLVCDLNDSFSVRDLVGKIVADRKLKSYFLSKNDN